MHCIICNAILTDDEAVLKDITTGAYLDTCSACIDEDLSSYDDLEDNLYYDPDTGKAESVVFQQPFDEEGNKVLDSDEL